MLHSPRILVAARVLAGLSQQQLAEAAGVALSVLQAIEQGRSDPKNSTLIAIQDALIEYGVRLTMGADGSVGVNLLEEISRGERRGTAQHFTNAESPGEDPRPTDDARPAAKSGTKGKARETK